IFLAPRLRCSGTHLYPPPQRVVLTGILATAPRRPLRRPASPSMQDPGCGLRRIPLLRGRVNNLRSCFTFIAVRYTVGNITIGKGGRGPAADREKGKPWRRVFKSRATRVVGVVVLGVVVLFMLLNWYVAPTNP